MELGFKPGNFLLNSPENLRSIEFMFFAKLESDRLWRMLPIVDSPASVIVVQQAAHVCIGKGEWS